MEEEAVTSPIPDYEELMRDLVLDMTLPRPKENMSNNHSRPRTSRIPPWAKSLLDWRAGESDGE